MATSITSAQINSYIDSELEYDGRLIYIVEYVDDGGETMRECFTDHADAYAFVRDEILSYLT